MTFEPGDLVFYTPNMPVPPISQRPWDVCTVQSVEAPYVNVIFRQNDRIWHILPGGLQHHPQSVKGIRQQMCRVLQEMAGAVQGRTAALVFSNLTGHTAQRGFGPADILRSFLDPRPIRKHRH